MVRKSNKKGKVDDIRVLDGDSNISDPSPVSSSGEATSEQRIVDLGLISPRISRSGFLFSSTTITY